MKNFFLIIFLINALGSYASYLNTKTINYSNGDKYVGQVVNGKRHGIGTYYFFETGDKFWGHWANGKRNGIGKYYYADGQIKSGVWKDDKYVVENNKVSLSKVSSSNATQKQRHNTQPQEIVPKQFKGCQAASICFYEQYYEDCIENTGKFTKVDKKDSDGITVEYLYKKVGGYIAIKQIPCNQCFRTTNCRVCAGFGYTGSPRYPIKCNVCQGTGKCQACGGAGQYTSYAEIGADGKGYMTNNDAYGNSYCIWIDENRLRQHSKVQNIPMNISNIDNYSNDIHVTPEQKFCPSCGGNGYHTRGGHVSPSSPIYSTCEFCGKEYNIEYTHTCKCNYCNGTGFVNR